MKNNVNDYLKQLDWRVNENANNGDPTPSGLMLYLANKEIAEHMLENVYPEEISNLHKDADIHIHDLGFGSVVYSFYGKNVLLIKHNNEIKFETFENLFDNYIGKTEIKDGNEIKYLENVYVEDYNTEWTKLIRVIRHEKQEEFIEVVSKNGNNVIVTENHPFFIAGNYEDICPNCQNKRYITKYTSDYYRRLQCKECNVKYNVKIEPDEISETIIKSKAIDSNFAFYKKHKHIKQSTDLGYIMGMFLAEGFINSYSNDNVSICQNNNEIKKYLYNFLDGNFRVNEKVIVSTNKEYLKLFKKCGHLSQNKKIPFLYENNTMGDILSGIIDGDGTISIRDNCLSISIRMTSYTLLQQLQSWLDSINVKSSLRSIKTYENINTKIISKLPLFSLNLTLTKDLFYLLNKSYKINNTEEPYNFRKNISPKEFPVINTKEFYVNKVEEKYVYDITTDSTSFLINGIKVHNCCGWSLEQLIREGINKVKGKASSHPAKHLSSLMIQIVNFLGVMQMEAAGAEAFNNVDTYLAPFVKIDNLPYETVKQHMQQLVFNLNIPSRWGCLSDDTEILTKNGWKYYDEVTDNELISTFNIEKNCMEYKPIQKMNVYDYAGELINFKNRKIDILMTPNHRNVIRKFNSNEYLIKQADELYDYKSPLDIPLSAPLNEGIETESDDMVKLVAWIIAEGYIPKNKGQKDSRIIIKQSEKHNSKYCDEIREVLNKCNIVFHEKKAKSGFTGEDSCTRFILNRIDSRKLNDILDKHHIPKSIMNSTIKQKELFIDTYVKADGWIEENRKKISTTSKTLKNDLMQIILETGHGVGCYFKPLEECSSYSTKPQYIITIYIKNHATITQKSKIQYTGKVWCPTVENGTFIARRKGTSFITGNSQAPFTNFTFDIKCPKDMENKKAIVGGKEQSFTYGDCQAEMDLINIAFMEVMEEGDADGQVHTFPIPTYNIDKNFDWNSKVTDKLFQMTSKYGIPYFANYVNSDMEASDIRSMAILGTQNVIYKNEFDKISKNEIRHLVSTWKKSENKPNYKILMNGEFINIIDMFEIPYEKYPNYIELTLENNIKQSFSYEHKCAVIRNGEYMEVESQDLQVGDYSLISNNAYDESTVGTYKAGKIVGYYLGDGWIHNDSEINLAINLNKIEPIDDIKDFFVNIASLVRIERLEDKKINKVHIHGKQAIGLIKQFINGTTAKSKRLNTNIWNTSLEFRKGVVDGLTATDGYIKENNIIHTTNKKLVDDLVELCNSIGIITKIKVNKKNSRSFKKDKSDYVEFTSYKLNKITKYETKKLKFGEFTLIPITNIRTIPSKSSKVYNFTVDTKEHLYELPNGIITHQCPLTKDTRVPFKIGDNKYKCTSIENIYKDYVDNPDLKVWTNMGWRKAKPVKTPMTKVFEITLNGDIKVKMGENHLQPVLNAGVIPAKHLIIGDFLPFSRKPFREKYLYEYRKITDITEVECKDDGLYCFEVDSEDHLFMLESGLMTHNCRLRLDLSELRKRGGGFFGSGDLTGSVGVVSINLPRLGYTAWDKEDFYKKLDYLLDMAKESLDIKRKEINKMLEKGYMPYMKRYLKDGFKNHFSTIGIVGMNECCINLIDEPISSEKGNKFANEVMDHINKRFSDYQINSKDRILYNLEATPAEGTSYRFAKHDKEKYIGIKTANDEGTPYYTNSSQLPVGFTDDIFAMLELQDELQSKYTSGTVQHLYLGEQIENPEVTKELVKKIFTNYKLPYISITPTFSTCIEHGYINGEVKDCPKCGKETLIWSRVVGYLRPTSAYNIGKKQEFKDRKYYEVE